MGEEGGIAEQERSIRAKEIGRLTETGRVEDDGSGRAFHKSPIQLCDARREIPGLGLHRVVCFFLQLCAGARSQPPYYE